MQRQAPKLAAAAAILLSASAAYPASAKPQIVTVTFNGFVSPENSIDKLGVFGPPGGDLNGRIFKLTFSINEKATGGTSKVFNGDTMTYEGPVTATLNINNIPLTIKTTSKGSTLNVVNSTAPQYEYNYSAVTSGKVNVGKSSVPASLDAYIHLPFILPKTFTDYHFHALSGGAWRVPKAAGVLWAELKMDTPSQHEDLVFNPVSFTVKSVAAP